MKLEHYLYYRIDAFRWQFTNTIRSAATRRHLLLYDPNRRLFLSFSCMRHDHMRAWTDWEKRDQAMTDRLRSLLPASELAACAAASLVTVGDPDG